VTAYETVALPAPVPDTAPDWPPTYAEVPGERFTSEGTTFAVVSVPLGTSDPRIRRDLAPVTCTAGVHSDGGTCRHACPGSRGLWPVELAGRESCAREPVYSETEGNEP
jgi:hypothetical protein